MNIEKRLEIYRSDYFFHIDFKEKIYARMVLFSVFITACITANFSMQDELMKLGYIQLKFVIGIWIASALVLINIIFIFVCITNLKSDEWVNSNTEMEGYRVTLSQHFINNSPIITEENTNKYVDEQFILYLVGQYSYCSAIININNVYRQKQLSRLAVSTYLLLILTFSVSLFFVYQKFSGEFNVSKSEYTTTTTTTNN